MRRGGLIRSGPELRADDRRLDGSQHVHGYHHRDGVRNARRTWRSSRARRRGRGKYPGVKADVISVLMSAAISRWDAFLTQIRRGTAASRAEVAAKASSRPSRRATMHAAVTGGWACRPAPGSRAQIMGPGTRRSSKRSSMKKQRRRSRPREGEGKMLERVLRTSATSWSRGSSRTSRGGSRTRRAAAIACVVRRAAGTAGAFARRVACRCGQHTPFEPGELMRTSPGRRTRSRRRPRSTWRAMKRRAPDARATAASARPSSRTE